MPKEHHIMVYDSQSEEYRIAFETFLRNTDQKRNARAWLDGYITGLSQTATFIDAGAGTGQLTSWLATKFTKTIAVEPNPYLCTQFRLTCPDIELLQEPIRQVALPALADLVLCSHVFYYIPFEEWLDGLERMVSWLKPGGVALLALQNPETDCMRMLHHFLGQRFDLWSLMEQFRNRHGNAYQVTLDTVPAHIQTSDFRAAYIVAEFMLNLLSVTNPPSQKTVEEYVSQSFVDAQEGYRFSCHQDFFQIQRNA